MNTLPLLEQFVRPFVPPTLFAAMMRRRTLYQNRAWPRPWGAKKSANRAGINVFGFHSVPFGLGQGVRSTTAILRCAGVPIERVDFTHEELAESLQTGHHRAVTSPYGVNLLQVNPQEMDMLLNYFGVDFFRVRYNIGYWVWEQHPTPYHWRHASAYVNELWVPSHYVRCVARAGGVKKNIRIIPHCVDLPDLPSGDIRDELAIPRSAALLLCLFDMASTEERKNPLATLRAIRMATEGMRDVYVVVKVRKPDMNPVAMQKIRHALEGMPHRMITHSMEKTELLRLIRSSAAYVSLHRSEGFGFFLAEAMALGRPVVATGYSGNMDYMNTGNSYPVKYERVRCTHTCLPYYPGFWWAEPDEHDAARILRTILLHPDPAAAVGRKAAAEMREKYSARAVAAQAETALREIGVARHR